ncbi:integrase core domain-containing protein [Streptomyces sp. NPDC127119]|uniref:integrase core domain-containing protein n=1 Tax=Streptomyces sp. NPDC127119 TaxID=3345370 RepID=UPI003638267A
MRGSSFMGIPSGSARSPLRRLPCSYFSSTSSRSSTFSRSQNGIGLYKTELIKPSRPWHGLADVELATAEWVDWFNNQRLHTGIRDIPPHEHESNYYAQHQPRQAAGVNA